MKKLHMMKPFGWLIFGGILLQACDSNKQAQTLPIMGPTQFVDKEVGGKTVKDTLYHTIADFQFVDQDSSVITNATLDGKVYVTDFFFTSCPTICPLMKKQMLRIYEAYENDPEVILLSHTIDPKHDTVGLLHAYAKNLGVSSSKWHFVTGDKDAIYELGEKSYMIVAGEDGDAPGGYIHSGAFLLVDQNRHIRGIYDGTEPEQVDKLMEDIKKLTKKDAKS